MLAWTDPWHHLYWDRLDNERIGGVLIAIRIVRPGILGDVALLLRPGGRLDGPARRAVIRFTGVYRAQAAVMLFGVLLPWVVDIIDMKRLWGFIPVDLVSMSFAVTGLTFLPGLLRFRLLDLTPWPGPRSSSG